MTSPAIISATLARLRGEATPADLNWEELVAFASAQLVLPALHPMPGAPIDSAEFLAGIQAANAARNVQMRASLAAIGNLLNGLGIEPILLKGAGLLATSDDACPWRFLSDLDLLVPAGQLEAAVTAANSLGFAARDPDYSRARDAHYPALIAPGGKFALELHTRIFADRLLPGLETRLPARASRITVGGAAFRLPALPDRIAHLIAHAQLHHGHYRTHRLLLRGFLEFSVLTGGEIAPELWSEVLDVFTTKSQKRAANAYIAAWRLLMRPPGDSPKSSPAEAAWAARAVARLGLARRARAIRAVAANFGAEILRALRDPAILARHLATLASPKAVAARITRHQKSLKQAFWA